MNRVSFVVSLRRLGATACLGSVLAANVGAGEVPIAATEPESAQAASAADGPIGAALPPPLDLSPTEGTVPELPPLAGPAVHAAPAAPSARHGSPTHVLRQSCLHGPVCEDRLERAGRPDLIAPWAHCTYGRKYLGYYVGGGAHLYGKRATCLCGESRYPHEGTFGIDYAPWWSRVRLQWYHGKRFQGGEGQYAPDGCLNPFEDVLGR